MRTKTGLNFDGSIFGELSETFKQYTKASQRAGRDALADIAQAVFEQTQREVPVDTTTLKTSGDLIREDDETFRIEYSATVAERRAAQGLFGSSANGDYNYAWIQHENSAYNHPKGGKSHYISDPLQEWGEIAASLIGDAIGEEMKKTARSKKAHRKRR